MPKRTRFVGAVDSKTKLISRKRRRKKKTRRQVLDELSQQQSPEHVMDMVHRADSRLFERGIQDEAIRLWLLVTAFRNQLNAEQHLMLAEGRAAVKDSSFAEEAGE